MDLFIIIIVLLNLTYCCCLNSRPPIPPGVNHRIATNAAVEVLVEGGVAFQFDEQLFDHVLDIDLHEGEQEGEEEGH